MYLPRRLRRVGVSQAYYVAHYLYWCSRHSQRGHARAKRSIPYPRKHVCRKLQQELRTSATDKNSKHQNKSGFVRTYRALSLALLRFIFNSSSAFFISFAFSFSSTLFSSGRTLSGIMFSSKSPSS